MDFLAKHIPVWVLLALSSTSVIAGDFFGKYWSVNQKTWLLVLAFIGYTASAFFYIPVLLTEGLVVSSVIWGLVSTIGLLVIGFGIFHEHLGTMQLIATALGVVSLVLFAMAGK